MPAGLHQPGLFHGLMFLKRLAYTCIRPHTTLLQAPPSSRLLIYTTSDTSLLTAEQRSRLHYCMIGLALRQGLSVIVQVQQGSGCPDIVPVRTKGGLGGSVLDRGAGQAWQWAGARLSWSCPWFLPWNKSLPFLGLGLEAKHPQDKSCQLTIQGASPA